MHPTVQVLYRAVASAAALQLQDTLLDLYCGTGSIGLTLASRCKAVVGYEVNGENLSAKPQQQLLPCDG
jgi:23S rRNA (uracil1939-C5)-methyltransferase